MKAIILALALFALQSGVLDAQARSLPAGSFEVAAGGSCSGFFNTCAARCKTRAPTDKNCVSDHCSPKLGECKAGGCWQEGALYGGAKTCGLK